MAMFRPSCTGESHYISSETLKNKVLDLYNMTRSILQNSNNNDVSIERNQINGILNECMELSFYYSRQRVSELLIEIGVMVRILHDTLSNLGFRENYLKHLNDLDISNRPNWLIVFKKGRGDNKHKIVQTCDKIIHALELSTIINTENVVSVEMRGLYRNEEWIVEVNIEELMISVFHIIKFETR